MPRHKTRPIKALTLFLECAEYPLKQLRYRRRALWNLLGLHGAVVFTWSFVQPYLQKQMVDAIVARNIYLLVAEVAIAIILYSTMHSLSFLVAKRATRIKGFVKIVLADKVAKALYGHIPTRRAGISERLTSRIVNEPTQLSQLVQFDLEMAGVILSSIFSIALCFIISRYALIPFFVIAPLVIPVSMLRAGKTGAASHRSQQQSARYMGVVSTTLKAIDILSPFQFLPSIRRLLHQEGALQQKAVLRLITVQADSGRRTRIAMMVVELSIFLAAGLFIVRTSASLGSFFALISAYANLADALKSLSEKVPKVIASSAQIHRFERFANRTTSRWFVTTNKKNQIRGVRCDGCVLSFGTDRKSAPIDFIMHQGQSLSVVGPNGVGKTTLLRMISGADTPFSGNVRVASPVSVAPSPPVFPPISVIELLRLRERPVEDVQRICSLAQRLRIGDRLQEIPIHWSDGERRRLAVLLALSKEAMTYVIDEPCSGLDEASKADVLQTIREATRGANLVVALHEIQLAESFDLMLNLPSGAPATT